MSNFKLKVKNIPQPPRKIGAIAPLIRRRSVEEALWILENTPRRAAQTYIKALKNAQATAAHNYRLNPQTLMIDEVFVTPGTRIRLGRKYRKRTYFNRYRRPHILVRQHSHIFLSCSGQLRQSLKKETKAKK